MYVFAIKCIDSTSQSSVMNRQVLFSGVHLSDFSALFCECTFCNWRIESLGLKTAPSTPYLIVEIVLNVHSHTAYVLKFQWKTHEKLEIVSQMTNICQTNVSKAISFFSFRSTWFPNKRATTGNSSTICVQAGTLVRWSVVENEFVFYSCSLRTQIIQWSHWRPAVRYYIFTLLNSS